VIECVRVMGGECRWSEMRNHGATRRSALCERGAASTARTEHQTSGQIVRVSGLVLKHKAGSFQREPTSPSQYRRKRQEESDIEKKGSSQAKFENRMQWLGFEIFVQQLVFRNTDFFQ